MSRTCPVRCWWRKRKKKPDNRPPSLETERAVIERVQADLEALALVEARIVEIESLLKDHPDDKET